jgi:hypothetical protein
LATVAALTSAPSPKETLLDDRARMHWVTV